MFKRLLTLTLALLLVVTPLLAAIPVSADSFITVYVLGHDYWSDVSLYAWEYDELEAWPGIPMYYYGNNWWYTQIPAGEYTNVVISNNQWGDVSQTSDLKIDGSADCWIVIAEESYNSIFDATVYVDSDCTVVYNPNGGVAPNDGLESLAIVGSGIPGLRQWDPADPAGDMTEIADKVYQKTITAMANTTILFKFAGNDGWDDLYNFGLDSYSPAITPDTEIYLTRGGGSLDMEFTPEKTCDILFTVDLNVEFPTLYFEIINEYDDDWSALEPNRIYAYVPQDWNDVILWAWNENGESSQGGVSWPGQLYMDYIGDGAYYIELPAGYPNMLITDGGTRQSADISTNLYEDGEVYIDITDPFNPNVYYSMGELVDNCPHNVHDQHGMCQVCGTIIEHSYDTNGYCSCGDYREVSVIIRPGDSGVILDPDIDHGILFDPNGNLVSEEVRTLPSFLLVIVVVVVVLILLLLALIVPVVLVVVIVIVIVSIVKKKKKK